MDPEGPIPPSARIIVTISREYGAGGHAVGMKVAERLGAEFVDSQLVDEVARRLQLPADVVRAWDERREGMILRLMRAMQAAHPEYTSPVGTEVVAGGPDPERCAVVVQQVLREEARSPRAVLVGRGAAFVLRADPHALHVRLVSDRAIRVARVAARRSISIEEAARELDRCDRERAQWIKHHFGVEARDAVHYGLVLNTGVLGFELSSDLVARAAIARASGERAQG